MKKQATGIESIKSKVDELNGKKVKVRLNRGAQQNHLLYGYDWGNLSVRFCY